MMDSRLSMKKKKLSMLRNTACVARETSSYAETLAEVLALSEENVSQCEDSGSQHARGIALRTGRFS